MTLRAYSLSDALDKHKRKTESEQKPAIKHATHKQKGSEKTCLKMAHDTVAKVLSCFNKLSVTVTVTVTVNWTVIVTT
jgi:hypothetical protein